jgi:hypothetical protein
MNLQLLCEPVWGNSDYVELALVECQHFDSFWINRMTFEGNVDSLARVELFDENKDMRVRCARLLYRVVNQSSVQFPFFPGNS